MISRLIFGTARLSGGAYVRRSRGLIEDCLKAGISAFDTAPSYGMGAAEGLLGEVCGGLPGVALHTKAGSPRPSHPQVLGWLKQARSLLPRGPSALPGQLPDYSGPAAGFAYGPAEIAASLARSQDLLQRDKIDVCLLHEAEPDDVPETGWALFQAAQRSGRAGFIGYAHYGPPRSQPAGLIGQVAPRPDDFARAATSPRIWHSLRLATELALAANGAGSTAIRVASRDFGLDPGNATDRLVAGLVALARADGEARMIFSTSDHERLRQVLDRISEIAPEVDAASLAQGRNDA